jgi:hypothetical protein
MKALELLKKGATQKELFVLASASVPAGSAGRPNKPR